MRSHHRRLKILGLAAAFTLAVTACSSQGGKQEETDVSDLAGSGKATTPRYTFAMITHEAPGDTFWDRIRSGAEAAAAKDNIKLVYSNDPQAPRQAQLIKNAIDQNVDGIASTMPNPGAIGPQLQKAVDAGIPVVLFNAGISDWEGTNALMYFGQDEAIAGEAAGARLKQEGAKHVLCVLQEQGQVQLEARCDGVAKGYGGKTTKQYVNGRSPTAVTSGIESKLSQDPSIDRVVTLGAPIALYAVQAVQGADSNAKVVTFDLNEELVPALKSGDVLWAIDQQPFVQGYEAVDSIWLYLVNGNTIGGGQEVLTGPSFVDESNIDRIGKFIQAGTR